MPSHPLALGFMLFCLVIIGISFPCLAPQKKQKQKKKRLPSQIIFLVRDKRTPSPIILELAKRIDDQYGIKPIITGSMPSDTGADVLTIHEPDAISGGKEFVLRRVDSFVLARRECSCAQSVEAAYGAVTQTLRE